MPDRRVTNPLPVVYIAGPITLGDPVANAAQADRAHAALLALGVAVVNPILTMYAGAALCPPCDCRPDPKAHGPFRRFPHDVWVRTSLALVERCDYLVRLPGESKGADAEVQHARNLGIRVFEGVESFIQEALREVAAQDDVAVVPVVRQDVPGAEVAAG